MPVFYMKAILPDEEYDQWMTYLRYKKPNVEEVQLAVLSSMVSAGLGGKGKVDDFLISNKTIKKKQKVKTAFDSFAAVAKPLEAS